MNAMTHLGNVLEILAELHPDDRCRALDRALAFYNERNPTSMVEPVDGYETRLVQIGPFGPLNRLATPRTETAQKRPASTETNVNEQRTEGDSEMNRQG